MRFGIVLQPPFADDAARAEELGFELGWLDERVAPAPLVVAAALAAATSGLRLAACVDAGPHPVTIAEEAAVADLACGGRLVLGLSGDDEPLLAETVDVLLAAFAARPFRHDGVRWRIPARLPEHELAEQRVRVAPAPAQLELPVWLAGLAGPAVAHERCLSFVSSDAFDAADQWARAERLLGAASRRLRRPALAPVECGADGKIAIDPLVARLRAERDAWSLDVLIIALPPDLGSRERHRALRTVATSVRPRLQIDRLPDGLEGYWRTAKQPVD